MTAGWRKRGRIGARASAPRDRRTRFARAVRREPAGALRADRRRFTSRQLANPCIGIRGAPGRTRRPRAGIGRIQSARQRVRESIRSVRVQLEPVARSRAAGRAVSSSFDVSAGLELQRERTGSTFITDMEGQEVQVKRRTAAYFAEARWTTSSSLFLTGGLRLDDIHRERFAETLDSDSVVSVNPRAAVAWFVRPGAANYTKLRGAIATGIRPPDGFELAFTDNPALEAGTQLQHRSGDRTGVCRWPRAIRGRCVLQRVRRSDCHRWLFPGLEPVPDRQHRECARARDRARIDRTSSIECAPGDRRPRARRLHVHGH